MHYIKTTRIAQSRVHSIDFDNIPFGQVFTDHMFVADYIDGQWTNMEIKPLEKLQIHPGNMAWHYGQSIFEGMKATRDGEGNPLLFRPEMHAKRFNASAHRMCMVEVPESLFLEAVHNIVDIERAWIPPQTGSAMYIRPLLIAMDESLGVRASDKYKFIVMALPVGPYYNRPVSLWVEQQYVRAADGGVGEAKAAGNYAASIYPAQLAKKAGYDQVMWTDAKEFKYIQEVGTMNIFFIIGNTVITPATDGSILKGITRDSIIQILRHEGYTVEERKISIDEVVNAYDAGELKEVFGAGTAAVIANVAKINYKGKIMTFDENSYTISTRTKNTINGMRDRSIEDRFNWVVPVRQSVEV